MSGFGLVIDTSANLCAVAIFKIADGETVASKVEDIGTGHAELLMGFIDEALGHAGIAIKDLAAIATVTGPGSFTGIRVGVSTARGLALALHVPCVGITTLDALFRHAHASVPDKPVLVAIDARRSEVYAAVYSADGEQRVAASIVNVAEATALYEEYSPVVIGSASPLFAASINQEALSLAATADIAVYAACAADALRKPVVEKPSPFYLRAPDAKPQAGFIIERRQG